MKKIITITIALLSILIINSCKKEDIPKSKVDEDGLTQNIKDLVPRWILDEMKNMGMPISGGDNPPDITGTYYAFPFDRIQSNIPNDNITVKDNLITFKNQNNNDLTISIDYLANSINPTGLTETGTGLGSFIVGNECKFSVFVNGEATIQGYTAKIVVVISGDVQDNGIANLHWANFMVDDKGDPGNKFIENGQGRVFIDKDGWSNRTDIASPATIWYNRLPKCPCTYADAQKLKKTQCPEGEWSDCGSASQTFHYGATSEIRWLPSTSGQPGQQCTYDASGKLITGGIAAGSPDKVSPRSCGFPSSSTCDHYKADVLPWGDKTFMAICGGKTTDIVPCWQYLRDWPASNTCGTTNIVSGIDHMKTMIGNMTCEEATLLIRKAKETVSPLIDNDSRNFIIGEPSTLTNAQVKVRLQSWRAINACSNYPTDPLCIVINKAIANLP